MGQASEVAMLAKWFEMLAIDEYRVTYGLKCVTQAMSEGAVETLFISDKLFRSKNIDQRKTYVRMHDMGLKDGLKVVVFSAQSPSGDRLNGMTGVAAILRY